MGGSVKVEATSMRLRCKLIHPPPHFLPRMRAARVFLPNLQRWGSASEPLALFWEDGHASARGDVSSVGILHYALTFVDFTLHGCVSVTSHWVAPPTIVPSTCAPIQYKNHQI